MDVGGKVRERGGGEEKDNEVGGNVGEEVGGVGGGGLRKKGRLGRGKN